MKKLSILGIFVADLAFFGKIPIKGETVLRRRIHCRAGRQRDLIRLLQQESQELHVNFISKIGNDDYGKMAQKIYSETNVGTKNLFITEKKAQELLQYF